MWGLTEKQFRFVVAYCETGHVTNSAISAGYSQNNAAAIGSENLTKPEIMAAIEDHRRDLAEAATVTQALIIRELLKIAIDRPPACRHCHGLDHQYQWTDKEFSRAIDAALSGSKPAPDPAGGFGYSKKREPHPECPECKGLGIAYEAEKTSDRMKALELLARIKQMMVERKEVSGPNGGPMQLQAVKLASEYSEEELALIVAGSPPLQLTSGV